jgi:hypothetical protein
MVMYNLFAVLVYAAAIAIPVYLLYHFHSRHWYWHVLAIAAGLALGLAPLPPEIQKRGFDLLLGFVLVGLLAWGVGGLIVFNPHHERHA